jgi:hypothetical protein
MMFVSIIKFVEAHKYCVIFFSFFLLPWICSSTLSITLKLFNFKSET